MEKRTAEFLPGSRFCFRNRLTGGKITNFPGFSILNYHYSGFLVAPPYSGGGGRAVSEAKKRVPEKNIGGSGGRRPVFEGVLKEKQSKNRQEGVKKTQLSRRPASNGTIGNRGEPSIEGGQPVFKRNP